MDSMVAGFRCIDGVREPMVVLLHGSKHDDYQQVANGLSWYALERCGHQLAD